LPGTGYPSQAERQHPTEKAAPNVAFVFQQAQCQAKFLNSFMYFQVIEKGFNNRNEVVEMRERRTSREEGETSSDEGKTIDKEIEEEEIITPSQAHKVPPEQEIDRNTSEAPQLKGREGREHQLWALTCTKLKEELEQIGQPKTGKQRSSHCQNFNSQV
jgi:hypothetical protein